MKEVTCRVCGKSFQKNFARHLKVHYKGRGGKIQYFNDYYRNCVDIKQEYIDSKLSASDIAKKVTSVGLFPVQKSEILDFLKTASIDRRSTSSAIKVWNDANGGPWNKGLTKDDHASIMSYSIARTGKNNPIYALTEKERQERVYYWLYKTKEELRPIRRKISETLKCAYSTGRVQHISKSDPECFKRVLAAMQTGWRKACEDGRIKRGNYSSSYEKKIADALEDLGLEHVRQKSILRKYRYDFFVPSVNTVIEFNGDYWHCYPPLFEASYLHPHKGMTAQEIWIYDHDKAVYAKSNGYNVVIIWEHELVDLDHDQIKEYVHEIIESYKCRAI